MSKLPTLKLTSKNNLTNVEIIQCLLLSKKEVKNFEKSDKCGRAPPEGPAGLGSPC